MNETMLSSTCRRSSVTAARGQSLISRPAKVTLAHYPAWSTTLPRNKRTNATAAQQMLHRKVTRSILHSCAYRSGVERYVSQTNHQHSVPLSQCSRALLAPARSIPGYAEVTIATERPAYGMCRRERGSQCRRCKVARAQWASLKVKPGIRSGYCRQPRRSENFSSTDLELGCPVERLRAACQQWRDLRQYKWRGYVVCLCAK